MNENWTSTINFSVLLGWITPLVGVTVMTFGFVVFIYSLETKKDNLKSWNL